MGKKSKIKKLTDEQYLAYITGLKEGSAEHSGQIEPPTAPSKNQNTPKDN